MEDALVRERFLRTAATARELLSDFRAVDHNLRVLDRQVRVEGRVERTSLQESEEYFQSRPRESQIGAWASPQSQAVPSRTVLEEAARKAKERFGDSPPRPPHWGGYRVMPRSMEFWQGRADRLHDRLLYTRAGSGWRIERLAP
jgi:pyridoxamine 5'-phosphate oxidase